jgi:hypothetical protein
VKFLFMDAHKLRMPYSWLDILISELGKEGLSETIVCLLQVDGPSYKLLLKREKAHNMDINSVQWGPGVIFLLEVLRLHTHSNFFIVYLMFVFVLKWMLKLSTIGSGGRRGRGVGSRFLGSMTIEWCLPFKCPCKPNIYFPACPDDTYLETIILLSTAQQQ